jgi:hypothetical protein
MVVGAACVVWVSSAPLGHKVAACVVWVSSAPLGHKVAAPDARRGPSPRDRRPCDIWAISIPVPKRLKICPSRRGRRTGRMGAQPVTENEFVTKSLPPDDEVIS